jgi:hypothetical protein
MAHSQAAYQRMGRMLADLGDVDLDAVTLMYVTELMSALRRRATRKRHANTLQHMAGYLKRSIDSDEVFKDKTVVVFALPGAFTPTCSSTHVPRYNQLAPELKRRGVDEIVCVSVNDAFVMNEWRAEQKAWNISFLPDGNGEHIGGSDELERWFAEREKATA